MRGPSEERVAAEGGRAGVAASRRLTSRRLVRRTARAAALATALALLAQPLLGALHAASHGPRLDAAAQSLAIAGEAPHAAPDCAICDHFVGSSRAPIASLAPALAPRVATGLVACLPSPVAPGSSEPRAAPSRAPPALA